MLQFKAYNVSLDHLSYNRKDKATTPLSNTSAGNKNTLTSLNQLRDLTHNHVLLNKPELSFTGKDNQFISHDFGEFTAFYKTHNSNATIDFEKAYCTKLTFKAPVLLTDAIELIVKRSPLIERSPNKSIVIEDKSKLLNIANELKHSQFKDIKITQLIGNGTGSTVFDIGDNKVLKVSGQNIFKRDCDKEIDVPFTRGELPNRVYWCKQDKADTKNVTTDDLLDLMIKIEDAGYETRDISDDSDGQAGWYKGKILLIDSECAAIL